MSSEKRAAVRFGAVLGQAAGDVPVYSSDDSTADETELPDRHA